MMIINAYVMRDIKQTQQVDVILVMKFIGDVLNAIGLLKHAVSVNSHIKFLVMTVQLVSINLTIASTLFKIKLKR
jgi:hypothetical protein